MLVKNKIIIKDALILIKIREWKRWFTYLRAVMFLGNGSAEEDL